MPKTTSDKPIGEAARAILCHAQELFAERGFDGASMSDIASAAGVSKANIFHHFGSKQTLYMEVLKSSTDKFGEISGHLEVERAPIEERLSRFLEGNNAHLQQHPQSARLLLRELLENRDSGVTQQLAEQATDAQFTQLLNLLRGAQQAGEIRDDVDPTALMLLMIGAVIFPFQVRSLIHHQPEASFVDDPKQYSSLLVDILLHGISAKESKK